MNIKLECKVGTLKDCFCKKCGRRILVDYNVSDEIWNQLNEQYQDKRLCFSCFLDEIKTNDEIFKQIIWW